MRERDGERAELDKDRRRWRETSVSEEKESLFQKTKTRRCCMTCTFSPLNKVGGGQRDGEEECVRRGESRRRGHTRGTAEWEKPANVGKTRADAVRTYKRHTVMQPHKLPGNTHIQSLSLPLPHTHTLHSERALRLRVVYLPRWQE